MRSSTQSPSRLTTKHKGRAMALLSTLITSVIILLGVGTILARPTMARAAQGDLTVEVLAGHNLVVDSNVLAPSTYAPSAATVAGRFCNSGSSTLTDVQGFIGNYTGDLSSSTPGFYPRRNTTDPGFASQHPHLVAPGGYYAFEHVGGQIGAADASRFIGDLAPGECSVQYWHFTYPRRSNPNNTGPEPVWGQTNVVTDDLWLELDIWGSDSSSITGADQSWTMTMRSEISAMANKIEPNPNGVWFNTNANIVAPGDVITSNGILYELGNINKGFDNDGDFVPDYNAWMQPVGDSGYDPTCFRLIRTSGVLTVARSGGLPDQITAFNDQLYFTNLPPDNTGVTGNVFYTFMALDGPCVTAMTPYQEVASGYDNEKFNADFGTGIPPLRSHGPLVTIDKSGTPGTVVEGATIDYTIPFLNSGTVDAGMALSTGGIPLVISDTVPDGTLFSSAGSNFSYGGGSATILYSTDSAQTWSTTAPVPGTVSSAPNNLITLQWWLDGPLPAGESGSATLQVTVPTGYIASGGEPFIENCADARFGNGAAFDEACTITLIQGSGTIGDEVWQDDDNNGVRDPGESLLDNVTVNLYWDQDGDGQLDVDDPFILSQDSATTGATNYDFTQLPAGDYIVQVDANDSDIPTGYYASTSEVVTLTLAAGQDFDLADFGFGPSLLLDKGLTSNNPAYEGESALFYIDVTNTRMGDGSPPGACTYTVWGASLDAANSGTGQSGWQQSSNLPGSPDSAYATAPYQGSSESAAITSFDLGSAPTGNIVSVEALVPVVINPVLAGTFEVNIIEATGSGGGTFVNSVDVTTMTSGLYAVDVTADRTSGFSWAFSDFVGGATTTSAQLVARKSGNPPGSLDADAVGYRITTDETCGNPDDTINPLPLTDTYDNSKLQFVSADPPATSVAGGTISWNNVGPVFAGQTKQITVQFLVLEPPDTSVPPDGEPDPTTHTNCAGSSGGQFGDGALVNDANDCVDNDIEPGGTIGDYVWGDANGDGVQDAAEIGLKGVSVTLYDCFDGICGDANDIVYETQVTDSAGGYLFTGIPDGTYYVQVDTTTLPQSGTINWTNTFDDDGPVFDSTSGPITIDYTDGNPLTDDYLGADFGYQADTTLLVGSIWNDINRNGAATPDAGEPGLTGITVYADDGSCEYPPAGNPNDDCLTAVTDASGDFLIVGLAPGPYTVRVITTTGDLATGGWTQSFDTDGTGTPDTAFATVVSGGVARVDYSYYQTGTSQIGDTIYADWNGDATQDSGEEGLGGVSVNLYLDDGDGLFDPSLDQFWASDTTDAGGGYLFDLLPPGDFLVVVDQSTLPVGYAQTQDPDESGVCATCDGIGIVLNVDGTSSYLDEDFGYQPVGTGSIGDFVWQDDDGDGIQDAGETGIANITVSLYEDSNNDGVIDAGDALVITATTDVSGFYSFTGLPAGDYLVQVETADPDLPADGNGDPYVLSTGNDPHDVALSAGEAYADADFGFTTGGIIGDFIWQDNDGDGSQDASEPGISGVTVYLCASSPCTAGNAIYTTVTDVSGLYEFSGLDAGSYVVAVDATTLPAGMTQTYDPNDPNGDLPCTSCDDETAIALAAGQIDRTADFGYKPLGVLGDFVWIDSDGDGVQDSGEPGIAGVTVYLDDGSCLYPPVPGPADCAVTATDTDGYYSFGNLGNATYTVTVDSSTLPANMTQTYDADGTLDHSTQAVIAGGVVTSMGGTSCSSCDYDADFGYRLNGLFMISGTVFNDANSNSTHDQGPPAEGTYANVTLYLWDNNNQLIGTTTTDANGDYQFNNLPNGSYTVSVNQNAPNLTGTSPTTPTSRGVTISNADVIDQDFGFVSLVDMGDLPPGYNTMLNDDGARHAVGTIYLGAALPDVDADGQESGAADGDDTNGSSDEDGVVRSAGVNWTVGSGTGSVDVTVGGCTGTCFLSAWIDWTRDGTDFTDAGERILLDAAVTNGTQTVTFDIPGSATFPNTYNVRFRLYESSTGGAALPYGLAINGEVEDYQWAFGPTAVSLLGIHDGNVWNGWQLSLLALAAAFATGMITFLYRNKRKAVVYGSKR